MFRLIGQLALLPYSFAEYQEMQLHQCPDLTVMGLRRSAENLGTVPRFLSWPSRLTCLSCESIKLWISLLKCAQHH